MPDLHDFSDDDLTDEEMDITYGPLVQAGPSGTSGNFNTVSCATGISHHASCNSDDDDWA